MARGALNDQLWQLAKSLKRFTRASLADKAECSYNVAQKHVAAWARDGLIRNIGRTAEGMMYRVADGQLEAGELGRSPEMNMWLAMRRNRTFTVRDLASLANTPSVPVSEKAAKGYCEVLLRSGYLKVLERANPSTGRLATYRLVRATGPLPPEAQSVRALYDPNTEAFEHVWRGYK